MLTTIIVVVSLILTIVSGIMAERTLHTRSFYFWVGLMAGSIMVMMFMIGIGE